MILQAMKNKILLIVCLATMAFAGMGCNTAHGFGKDVSNAGQGIQNAAPSDHIGGSKLTKL